MSLENLNWPSQVFKLNLCNRWLLEIHKLDFHFWNLKCIWQIKFFVAEIFTWQKSNDKVSQIFHIWHLLSLEAWCFCIITKYFDHWFGKFKTSKKTLIKNEISLVQRILWVGRIDAYLLDARFPLRRNPQTQCQNQRKNVNKCRWVLVLKIWWFLVAVHKTAWIIQS